MPKTGMPAASSVGSNGGAPSAYTLEGPPERITAAGLRASSWEIGSVCGTTSL